MSQAKMSRYKWKAIPWKKFQRNIFKLQKRIYRASQRNDLKTVHKLQRLLMKSRMAKFLAVRNVCQKNKGKRTAGVDGIKAPCPKLRTTIAEQLGSLPVGKPLRRIWIPKPGKKKKRPLGIPTIYDRALQALVKMALEPEWEAKFEANSYGFRPGRSAQDAIAAIYFSINKTPKFVLDADIAGCFDCIDHQALLNKIGSFPKMKKLIKRWLEAGVMEDGIFKQTKTGTPQGGIVSPLLANIALHGLETHIKNAYPRDKTVNGVRRVSWKPNIIRYADDFVILHRSIEEIKTCQQLVEEWLSKVGLKLSQEKTQISHTLEPIEDRVGFDFLGFNLRQYPVGKGRTKDCFGKPRNFKTFIKPSKETVLRHGRRLKTIVKMFKSKSQEELIKYLQPRILGWAYYYRSVVSRKVFEKLDEMLFFKLWSWAKRRHSNRSKSRIKEKYWGKDKWIFSTQEGVKLVPHSDVKIKRYIKIQGTKSPFDGDNEYWQERLKR